MDAVHRGLVRPADLAGAALDGRRAGRGQGRPPGRRRAARRWTRRPPSAPSSPRSLPLTRGPAPLVDELVVVDSGSTDRTVEVAAAAGARVVLRTDVLPELEPVPGKGEVLWRSLAATTSDIVCYLDSDLVDFDPAFVPGAARPAAHRAGRAPGEGLLPAAAAAGDHARPTPAAAGSPSCWSGRCWPRCGPSWPASCSRWAGEYAGTRELLESVPFAAGYGVEIGLLLDTHAARGLDALAQVNLGVRKHRNRSLLQLGVMARQILAAVLARCATAAGVAPDSGAALVQFLQVDGEWLPSPTAVPLVDRPPMREVDRGARRGAAGRGLSARLWWDGGVGTALSYLLVAAVGGGRAVRDRGGRVRARRGAAAAAAPGHPDPAAGGRASTAGTCASCGSRRPCAATGWTRWTGCWNGWPTSWTGSARSATGWPPGSPSWSRTARRRAGRCRPR